MSLSRESQSRFRFSTPIVRDNIETFGLMMKHNFLDPKNLTEDDIVSVNITHEFVGKPWAVAEKLYGSPMLDWVIVLFNKPLNPVNWPHMGTVIKAPSINIVLPNV